MSNEQQRQRRWRLILGSGAADGINLRLSGQDAHMDEALGALYDQEGEGQKERSAGLGGSAPRVARWLGDIREYFPSSVVRVLQQDAIAGELYLETGQGRVDLTFIDEVMPSSENIAAG